MVEKTNWKQKQNQTLLINTDCWEIIVRPGVREGGWWLTPNIEILRLKYYLIQVYGS